MTGNPRFAQSIRKLIPGTFSGSYKGAQPVVRALLDRGPVANETEVSGVPCACEAYSSVESAINAPAFTGVQRQTFGVCGDDFVVGITNGTAWSSGFLQLLSLQVVFDTFNGAGGCSVGFAYTAYIAGEGGAETTVRQGLGRCDHNDTVSETTGLAKPIIGDRLELVVSSARTAPITASMVLNGSTLHSVTETQADTQFYGMNVYLVVSGDQTLDFSNYTIDVTC